MAQSLGRRAGQIAKTIRAKEFKPTPENLSEVADLLSALAIRSATLTIDKITLQRDLTATQRSIRT